MIAHPSAGVSRAPDRSPSAASAGAPERPPAEWATERSATAEALVRLGVDRKLIPEIADGDPKPLAQLPTPGLEASKRRITVPSEI